MRAVNPVVFYIFLTIRAGHEFHLLNSGTVFVQAFIFCPGLILLYSLYFQNSTDLHNGNQMDTSLTCSLQAINERKIENGSDSKYEIPIMA